MGGGTPESDNHVVFFMLLETVPVKLLSKSSLDQVVTPQKARSVFFGHEDTQALDPATHPQIFRPRANMSCSSGFILAAS